MPRYFDKNEFQNPTNNVDGPFQFAFNTKLDYFGFIKQDPRRLSAFNAFMQVQGMGRDDWLKGYPIQQSLIDGRTKKDVLLVDVGGGQGQVLEAFKREFPSHRGRLILQDLPQAISNIEHLEPGIETMEMDFFNPQPIKGSKNVQLIDPKLTQYAFRCSSVLSSCRTS